MKKTLVKLGAAALALTLALVFAACAQPTEESSGPNAPTIIRLYLDRDDATLVATDTIEVRAAKALYVPDGVLTNANSYPYPPISDTAGVFENPGRDSNTPFPNDNARKNKNAIPARRANNAPTVLQDRDPKSTYLTSGAIALNPTYTTGGTGGSTIQVPAKGPYYVDIELINQTPGDVKRGDIFAGSLSAYVELTILRTAPVTLATGDPLPDATYLYTRDKHGFNDLWKMDAGVPIYKTTNSRIGTVSLKPGLNELYLSYFSYDRSEN
jgi:hypothetical protein